MLLFPHSRPLRRHGGGAVTLCRIDRTPISADGGGSQTASYLWLWCGAHIIAQVAIWEGREVYAFTREGDLAAQGFARSLGEVWAGASGDPPPEPLDAAIIFAPVGPVVPLALRVVAPGGIVVCAGIHMSDIPTFPYGFLWEER